MNNNPPKLKILYIITQGEWGGAQRYVFDLVNNLADIFDITIAIGEIDGDQALKSKVKSQKSKVKIVELKHLVRNISPVHDVLAIFELKKLYKTLKPDIIHLNSSKAGIIGSLAIICHSCESRNPDKINWRFLDSRLRGNDTVEKQNKSLACDMAGCVKITIEGKNPNETGRMD